MSSQVDLYDFIQHLKAEIKKGLPGEEAQYRMAPSERRSTREYLASQPSPRKSSVSLLIFPVENVPQSILLLRPSYAGVHSGQVCLPGGKFEESDLSLEHTAIREIAEETGMDPSLIQVVGELSHLYIPVSNALVHPYILYTNERPLFHPDKLEVEELIEFKLAALQDPEVKKRKKITLSTGLAIEAPYYEISTSTVWGATAMILSEFEALLERIDLPTSS